MSLVVLALLGGAVAIVSELGNKEIKGWFLLIDSDVEGSGPHNCSGSGGYSDFGPGMQVTVRNEEGRTIGNSRTRNASIDALSERLVMAEEFSDRLEASNFLSNLRFDGCVVLFEVDVENAEFYEIEAGRRGGITFSHEDLVESDWYVGLSLGS